MDHCAAIHKNKEKHHSNKAVRVFEAGVSTITTLS
jgi:hypothetical protein